MLRAETSTRSLSPAGDSRSQRSGVAKSIYGNAKNSGCAANEPGAVRFKSTTRAIPVATPGTNDVKCLVSRADGTASAGLIDGGDSRRGMMVITGGKNGRIHLRSALTGSVDNIRSTVSGSASAIGGASKTTGKSSTSNDLVAGVGDIADSEIGQRLGMSVTAMSLGPGNKLWVGYNDGTMRVYGLDARSKLLGEDTIVPPSQSQIGGSRRSSSAGGLSSNGSSYGDVGRRSSFGGAQSRSGASAFGGGSRDGGNPASGGNGQMATALQNRGRTEPPKAADEVGLLHEARKHSGGITAIVRTDVCVFSCAHDWQIMRWSVHPPFNSEGCVGSHSLSVRCMLVTPRYLVTGGDDTEIKCWPFQPLDKPCTLSGHASSVVVLCYHRGLLWSGCEDGNIRLWDVDGSGGGMGAKTCVQVLTPHSTQVTTITPLDNTMYTCDKAGNILVWDLSKAHELTERKNSRAATTSSFSISALQKHNQQLEEQESSGAFLSATSMDGSPVDAGLRGGSNASFGQPPTPSEVTGVELLHVFRAPLPKPVKTTAIPSVATRLSQPSKQGAGAQRTTPTTPRLTLSQRVGAKPVTTTTASTTIKQPSSSPSPSSLTNKAYIHDVKLVCNVKGILAWLLTTEGCKMVFLPHRPIEEELERKLGPMADLDDEDDDELQGAHSGVFTKDEIINMQRQLETFEEREAEQYERLQEVQEEVDDFAAFTGVMMEDVLNQSLELMEEHRERCEKLMAQSEVALQRKNNVELIEALKKIKELEGVIGENENKLQEKTKLLSSINSKHANQMAAKTDEISKLSTELAKCQQEVKQTTFDLRHSKDALALSEATVKRQTSKLDKAAADSKEIAALKVELKRTKEQIETVQEAADRHVASAKKHSEEAAERIAGDLAKDLKAVETERDEAAAAYKDASAKVTKMTLELVARQSENEHLKQEIEVLKQSLDRRSISRAKSEGNTDSMANAAADGVDNASLQTILQGIFETIGLWRAERELPPISLAALDSIEVDGTGESSGMLDRLKVEHWPSLVEMYNESKEEISKLEEDLHEAEMKADDLVQQKEEAAKQFEDERKQMAVEKKKIAMLQESVALLKKKAIASATSSGRTTPVPEAAAAEEDKKKNNKASVKKTTKPAKTTSPEKHKSSSRENTPPKAKQPVASAPPPPVVEEQRTPSASVASTTTALEEFSVASNTTMPQDEAVVQPPAAAAEVRASLPTPAKKKVVTLADLAEGKDSQLNEEAAADTKPPTPEKPQQQQPLASEPPVDVVAISVVHQDPVSQQQQQQTPPPPQSMHVTKPTRSLFEDDAATITTTPTPITSGTAGAATTTTAGRSVSNTADIEKLDPSDPLFEALLTKLTERAEKDRQSSAAAVASFEGEENGSDATNGNENDADELGMLVKRIDRTKKQLVKLEAAAAAAHHPTLKEGLQNEIRKLHRQLVGDSQLVGMETRGLNGEGSVGGLLPSVGAGGSSSPVVPQQQQSNLQQQQYAPQFQEEPPRSYVTGDGGLDGFTHEMEEGLHNIVRASHRQQQVERDQQQQLLTIIYQQQQQLLQQQKERDEFNNSSRSVSFAVQQQQQQQADSSMKSGGALLQQQEGGGAQQQRRVASPLRSVSAQHIQPHSRGAQQSPRQSGPPTRTVSRVTTPRDQHNNGGGTPRHTATQQHNESNNSNNRQQPFSFSPSVTQHLQNMQHEHLAAEQPHQGGSSLLQRSVSSPPPRPLFSSSASNPHAAIAAPTGSRTPPPQPQHLPEQSQQHQYELLDTYERQASASPLPPPPPPLPPGVGEPVDASPQQPDPHHHQQPRWVGNSQYAPSTLPQHERYYSQGPTPAATTPRSRHQQQQPVVHAAKQSIVAFEMRSQSRDRD